MYTARRILVVDDEPLIAALIADWLQELGCVVAGTVNNAAEALQIANEDPLDAALLDVSLRGGDSFSLADTLLAKGLPIAFITGRDSGGLPERFRQTPVLGKPFDFEAIRALLDRLVTVRI
jgi:CheY-like chemotaxis protein